MITFTRPPTTVVEGETAGPDTRIAECRASVEPLSGRELFESQQVVADVTHRVRIRWREEITPELEINYQGRTLQIVSVIDPGERHRELELLCRERV